MFMEVVMWIIGVLVVIAALRVFKKDSTVKKYYKEVSSNIMNGTMDNKIIEMAKDGHYAIGGFVTIFLNEATRKAKYSLEEQNLEIDNFNYSMEFVIKDAEKDIENSLRKRFKVLNVKMDEY